MCFLPSARTGSEGSEVSEVSNFLTKMLRRTQCLVNATKIVQSCISQDFGASPRNSQNGLKREGVMPNPFESQAKKMVHILMRKYEQAFRKFRQWAG